MCVRGQVRGSLSAFDASEGQFQRSVPAALSVLAEVPAADRPSTEHRRAAVSRNQVSLLTSACVAVLL